MSLPINQVLFHVFQVRFAKISRKNQRWKCLALLSGLTNTVNFFITLIVKNQEIIIGLNLNFIVQHNVFMDHRNILQKNLLNYDCSFKSIGTFLS